MKINANTQYNQQFNGRIGKFKTRKLAKRLEEVRSDASFILDQDYKDVLLLTKGAAERKIEFFNSLIQLYNKKLFTNRNSRENSTIINKIYKNVQKPKKIHTEIINNFTNSLESLNNIFSLAGNSTKKLKFAQKINELIKNNDNITTELLSSKFNKFYINNFKKIKSYLLLNQNNPDSIKELDNMIKNKTFTPEKYNKMLELQEVSEITGIEENSPSSKIFIENYSKARIQFLQIIQEKYLNLKRSLSQDEKQEIQSMYLSTNNKNIKLRSKLLEYFDPKLDFFSNKPENKNLLKNSNILFEMADNDKHTRNYLQKIINSKEHLFEKPKDIIDLLTNISPKKLDIFFENSKRIIKNSNKENRIDELKNNISKLYLENSNNLDTKYNYKPKKNLFKKVYLYISHSFNIIRDNLTKDTKPLSLKTNENITAPIKNIEKEVVKTNPVIENLNQVLSNTKSENKATSLETKAIVTVENKTEEKPINNDKPIKKENILKKMTSRFEKIQKQDALHQDIISFINKKLGAKTFSNQREKFIENATKMRYEMLPEIFASISDTRKADRAVGKYRINSANKDALNLYLKINGNNKKFVNYLLKKRNVDGSRMFEVKDIINMLDKAEQQIKKQRQNNPEYRARDVRKYYNHLLESKIEQYGKVTRQKSKKTK